MNIKDFLIANYIYIIIVIVLIIITIIGFLADKKGKGKSNSKDILPNNNRSMGNVGYGVPGQNPPQPMNYQQIPVNNEAISPIVNGPVLNNNVSVEPVNINPLPNNNMINANNVNNGINPVANALAQNVPNTANEELNVMPGTMQGTIVSPNMNQVNPMEVRPMSAPQPVTSVPVNPEPMYQPAPEQVPVIPAVDPISNIQSYNQMMGANNGMVSGVNINPMDSVNNIANYGSVAPVMQSTQPMPIPTPTEPAPPVAPIPNVPNGPVNPVPVPNPQMPNQMTMPQPVGNGQFNNFVYGNQPMNQNNNNGYMQ